MSLWVAFASFVVALAALAAVIWQILRAEAQQPLDGLVMQRRPVHADGNHTDVWVTIALQGPIVAYRVRAEIWDGAVIGDFPEARARMTSESEPLVLLVRVPHGHRTRVGITWMSTGMIRRRAQISATRREVLGDETTYEDWKWNKVQWSIFGSNRAGRGKWVPVGQGRGPALFRLPPQAESRPIEAVLDGDEYMNFASNWPDEIPTYLAPDWIQPAVLEIAQLQEEDDEAAEDVPSGEELSN